MELLRALRGAHRPGHVEDGPASGIRVCLSLRGDLLVGGSRGQFVSNPLGIPAGGGLLVVLLFGPRGGGDGLEIPPGTRPVAHRDARTHAGIGAANPADDRAGTTTSWAGSA